MQDALGNHKSLLWTEVDRVIFEVDDKVSLQDKEEFVVGVVLVPVVLALHHS